MTWWDFHSASTPMGSYHKELLLALTHGRHSIYRLLSSIKTSADSLFALQVIVQFHNPW